MKQSKELIRYGSVEKGNVYKRELLEEYVDRYRCMMIEVNAQRGILACNYNDDYKVIEIIENAGGSFVIGHTVVSNKFFEQVIIVKKVNL